MKKSPAWNKVSHYLQTTGSIYLCSCLLLLCFFTLLYSILLLLISSFKFLLHVKAVTGSSWNDSLNPWIRWNVPIFTELYLLIKLAEYLLLLRCCCLFLLKVLSCPFFLLLLCVYLLALVCNLDLQISLWATQNSDWSHLV